MIFGPTAKALLRMPKLQIRRLRPPRAQESPNHVLASEGWYRLLVEQAPEAILVYDIDANRFIAANKKAEELFGCGREELLRWGPTHFYTPDQPDARPVNESFAEHNKRAWEQELFYERRIRSAQGREAVCEVRLGRLPSAQGRLLRASFVDITERKMAESALARERDFSTTLMSSLPGLVVLIDERGRLIRWNEGLPALTGLSDEQLRGLDTLALVVEEERDVTRARMREAFVRGIAEVEFGIRTQGDGVQILHFSGRVISNAGHPPYLLAAGTNVTKQREAERRLRDSEERLRSIFESINDGIIVHNIETGAFIDINPRLCAMFGYAREEMLRLGLGDLSAGVPPYTLQDAAPLMQRAISGVPVLFEWLCRKKDGSQLWIEVSLRRARFGGRDVLLSAARDISQRKQAEDALRASETRYRDLFEHTLDAIMTIDPSTASCTSANAGAVRLFGLKDETEFLGRRPSDYSPERQPDGRASVEKQQEMIATAVRTGAHFFEWTYKRFDGTEFPADVLLTRVEHEGKALIYATVRDITERKRATETIRLQADQHATMLATTSDGYWILDMQGRFIEVNDAYCRMTGYSREELLKLRIADVEANESPEEVERHMAAVIASGFDHFESRHRRKDGSLIDIEGSVSFWRNGDRVLVFGRDITARKRAEQELARSEIRLRTVLDTAVDGITMVDTDTRKLLFANQSLCTLLGYSADELRALSICDIHPADALPQIWRGFERQRRGETIVAANVPTKRKDGSIFFADISASPIILDGGAHAVVCFHDVTERKLAEEQMRKLARYDLLTGLANRSVFVDALNQAIARVRRTGESFSLLYLDLDHFKDVNDTLGHPVGDLLLQAVADRLRQIVREVDTVARFGGDEFAVLLTESEDPMDAAVIAARRRGAIGGTVTVQRAAATAGMVAEKLLHAVSEPFSIAGNEIRSGTSVGIAVFGSDSVDPETMLSHADVALYRAKSEARGSYRFFSPVMEADVRARVAMGTELRAAIGTDQIFLEYQPQVELGSGRIVGLEALVRWRHPTRGMVGPGNFIPEAERNGLIVPLGQWILREACRQAKSWRDAGIAPPVIAVNLSGVQFKRPLALEKDIAAVVAESGLPAGSLELELTEGVLMEASREHNEVLLRFRKTGYHLAIDDFGTGYSSLDYLRRFPVDRIKIAQSFIADIGQASGNDVIVKAALGLARELNIEVVVEGAETDAQIDLLRSWGCRIVQGFYFSRPLAAPEATELLRIGRIAPASVEPERTIAASAAA